MTKITISKKLAIGITGFITCYYLNSFAVFTISAIVASQLYWLKSMDDKKVSSKKEDKKNVLLINIDNLIYKMNEKPNETLDLPIFGYKSTFITGYIAGVIYQYLYVWVILAGCSSGLIISYKYNPTELEEELRSILVKHKYIRLLLGNVSNITIEADTVDENPGRWYQIWKKIY